MRPLTTVVALTSGLCKSPERTASYNIATPHLVGILQPFLAEASMLDTETSYLHRLINISFHNFNACSTAQELRQYLRWPLRSLEARVCFRWPREAQPSFWARHSSYPRT